MISGIEDLERGAQEREHEAQSDETQGRGHHLIATPTVDIWSTGFPNHTPKETGDPSLETCMQRFADSGADGASASHYSILACMRTNSNGNQPIDVGTVAA